MSTASTRARGSALAQAIAIHPEPVPISSTRRIRPGAIQGAKRTPDLIPLCHPLPLTAVEVVFDVGDDGVRVEATARVTGQTGVEMEALTAAAVAGLTLIDMVKAVEKGVTIERVRLLAKSGGRSGDWRRG